MSRLKKAHRRKSSAQPLRSEALRLELYLYIEVASFSCLYLFFVLAVATPCHAMLTNERTVDAIASFLNHFKHFRNFVCGYDEWLDEVAYEHHVQNTAANPHETKDCGAQHCAPSKAQLYFPCVKYFNFYYKLRDIGHLADVLREQYGKGSNVSEMLIAVDATENPNPLALSGPYTDRSCASRRQLTLEYGQDKYAAAIKIKDG